jgi:hypothetical protein
MPIKKLLSACAVLLLCGLLFVACDGPEAAITPVKMTAVYIPEEDNIYERMRSKLVIKLKGKEFQNRRGKDKATDKNTLSHPKSRITAKYKKK